jgi:hypothetical protein
MKILTFSYSLILLILFIQVNFISSSLISDDSCDIEYPFIDNDLSSHQCSALRDRYEYSSSDSDITALDENPAWKYQLAQYFIGSLANLSQESFYALVFNAAFVVSLLACVQLYYGFFVSFHRQEGSLIPIPRIFQNIVLPVEEKDSFIWWIISGYFSFVFEVLFFIPIQVINYLDPEFFVVKPIPPHIMLIMVAFVIGMLASVGNKSKPSSGNSGGKMS